MIGYTEQVGEIMDTMGALLDAVRKGDLVAVGELLKDNPDMAVGKSFGPETPLHLAAEKGYKDIAESLLAHGAPVNAENWDGNGYRPLHSAVLFRRKPLVELLLAHGADVNAKNDKGETPLHLAAWNGDKGIAEVLLANRANTLIASSGGDYPSSVAILRGHKDVQELLRQHGEQVQEIDDAAQNGNLGKVMELLKQNPAVVGYARGGSGSPLLEAVEFGHTGVAAVLLAAGADVTVRDFRGRTTLHLAVAKGNKDVLELLLANKAEVDAKDNSGDAPLQLAVNKGSKGISELLLAAGADVNARDSAGNVPLYWAAAAGEKDIVQLLLAGGAEVNAKNEKAWTPLDRAATNSKPSWLRNAAVAAKCKEVADVLRDHGGQESSNAEKLTPKRLGARLFFVMVLPVLVGVGTYRVFKWMDETQPVGAERYPRLVVTIASVVSVMTFLQVLSRYGIVDLSDRGCLMRILAPVMYFVVSSVVLYFLFEFAGFLGR